MSSMKLARCGCGESGLEPRVLLVGGGAAWAECGGLWCIQRTRPYPTEPEAAQAWNRMQSADAMYEALVAFAHVAAGMRKMGPGYYPEHYRIVLVQSGKEPDVELLGSQFEAALTALARANGEEVSA